MAIQSLMTNAWRTIFQDTHLILESVSKEYSCVFDFEDL